MKFLIILVFLAVSAVSAKSFEEIVDVIDVDAVQTQPWCEPGKRFKLADYSSCICSADGSDFTCTRMYGKEVQSEDSFFENLAKAGYNVISPEEVYCYYEPCNCNCNCP